MQRDLCNCELKQALQKSNDSAVGPDDIHYKLLTNLPESSLTLLLAVFNSIWESGIFPPSWREATIVAIPKPGKDSSDPNNYRPIASTSCSCKTWRGRPFSTAREEAILVLRSLHVVWLLHTLNILCTT